MDDRNGRNGEGTHGTPVGVSVAGQMRRVCETHHPKAPGQETRRSSHPTSLVTGQSAQSSVDLLGAPRGTRPRLLTGAARAAIIGLLALLALQAGSGMWGKSPTYDERKYLGLGKYLLMYRNWNMDRTIYHPPLTYYIHSIPFFAWGWHFKADLNSRAQIRAARLCMIPLALLLGLYVFKWASELYGLRSGLLAAFLCSFCPNILAHAGLITADVAVTCFLFITAYYFARLLAVPFSVVGSRLSVLGLPFTVHGSRFSVLAGLAFGLALLSKYTAVFFVPILAMLLLVGVAARKWPSPRRVVLHTAIALLLALLILNLGYGFKDSSRSPGSDQFKSDLFGHLARSRLARTALALLPEPYVRGMDFQQRESERGGETYILGQVRPGGCWYYFLVAFLVKTPVPFLILLAWAAGGFIRRTGPSVWPESLILVTPVFFFVHMSFFNHLNIGLRYVLPAFPFLFVFASRVAAGRLTRWRVAALLALALWHAASSLSVRPHYLAYFNEWASGPSKGYQWLADSNLDWGQDLWLLADHAKKAQDNALINPGPSFVPGKVIVNANSFCGLITASRSVYTWLRRYDPVGSIGYSWLIFDVPRSDMPTGPAAAPSHLVLGALHARTGHVELALREYQAALQADPKIGAQELPGAPRSHAYTDLETPLDVNRLINGFHASLGALYLQTGQLDEGIRALKHAIEVNPMNASAHRNLGLAYVQKGDAPNARVHLQRAAELFGPDSPEAQVARAQLAELTHAETLRGQTP